ncbi:MAG TPA: S9 family peptidase [Elusimicrobiales bacterium]|nr:S9 family peptidase [Elusimicrobiales bacterium]
MNNLDWVLVFAGVFAAGVAHAGGPRPLPPKAAKVPHRLEKHGHVRTDDYFWLRERDNPEVLEYLKAENAYADAVLAPVKKFSSTLFAEMKSRIKKDDSTPPFKDGPYYYYTRYKKGGEYPLYCRRAGSPSGKEEVLLDVNREAKGHAFFDARFPVMSPDHNIMAWAADTKGRRFYTVRFKDLRTGRVLPDRLENVTPNLVWAEDGRTLFYAKQHPETLRWDSIFRHELGAAADAEVYHEPDETFTAFVAKSRSRKYLFIGSQATLTTEYRYLDASAPSGEWRLFLPRERGLEYAPEHAGDRFYVLHNRNARNFMVSEAEDLPGGPGPWKDFLPHREDTLVEDIDAFRGWLVVSERRGGLPLLRVMSRSGAGEHYLEFDDPAYLASAGVNREYDSGLLRFNYESLTTPDSVYDYDMASRERTLLKRQEVLGGFRPEDYVSERVWAPARDGAKVPVSLVYRKDFRRGSGAPLHIYSYGSYGSNSDPYFSSVRLSLLDRGFVCAIPHIRGGSELGRAWYEDGRQRKKMNTFNDFIDATEYLVKEGYAARGRVHAEGGSAGGLLMGAVANMAPEGLYRSILAEVPFVDVVTTMLDDSIPLTTGEYDEWGDPNVKEDYEYMLSYSPYDNVSARPYPAMFITAGLHDSQVQYWEPAKWAAKLRALKTGSAPLVLKTDMEVGHGGKSGRFEALKLVALEYAFMLELEGIGK